MLYLRIHVVKILLVAVSLLVFIGKDTAIKVMASKRRWGSKVSDYWTRRGREQRQKEYEKALPYLTESAIELAREGDFSRLEHIEYLLYDREGREEYDVTLEELRTWFANLSEGR